ncbi:hypothetical protein [Rhizobium mesoamericanum]|uniref:hypothetical protein n=1 Tax=Rhizobium mesoamericanum TaxID=1079800 RepID=UPI0005950778|nr:hypothetical protein [Rhizobium mesoamericanum]
MERQAVVFNGQHVGIAVPLDERLKFIAVKFHVIELDNELFDSVGDIKRAIRAHLDRDTQHATEARH